MNINIKNFRQLEKYIVEEKGAFQLLALFLREDSPGKWDFIVSAEWIDEDKYSAIRYIAEKMNQHLSFTDRMIISRIVPIETHHTEITHLIDTYHVSDKPIEIYHNLFFDVAVERAYILTTSPRTVVS